MKKLIFAMAALSLASLSFAQEFDFGGGDDFGSGDDFSGGFEESSTPAVTISGEVGADARAWIGNKNEDTGLYDTKGYDGFYDLSKTNMDADAHANLELNYAGDYTDANLKLKLDSATLKDHPEDVIDELFANGSFKEGKFQLKVGKMKEVWGKGDKVHVLDNFNANDYTDFIFPDYIDRRIGEVMFKTTANISWDYNIKLEGIYTPWMTADRFAESGMLVPYSMTKLTNTVKGILKHNYGKDATDSITAQNGSAMVEGVMKLSDFSTASLYEDNIRTLKYGQGGIRLTGTLGGIDWGASYYYGHYKQPSANLGKTIVSLTNAVNTDLDPALAGTGTSEYATYLGTKYASEIAATAAALLEARQATDATTAQELATKAVLGKYAASDALEYALSGGFAQSELELPSLNYDQLQVFGLEAAFVLWKLNTRWEFAYNLTEDIAGDDPWVKNNSISWVAGFDIDLPIHNLNLNVQENGSFILHKDKIEDGPYATYDTDYKVNGKYTSNKIIALISDKWLNEKLTTEVQGIYTIETKEFMVAPKVEYNVSEGLTLTARGVYLYSNNEDGEFYNFTKDSENHDKAFLQLSAKYQF